MTLHQSMVCVFGLKPCCVSVLVGDNWPSSRQPALIARLISFNRPQVSPANCTAPRSEDKVLQRSERSRRCCCVSSSSLTAVTNQREALCQHADKHNNSVKERETTTLVFYFVFLSKLFKLNPRNTMRTVFSQSCLHFINMVIFKSWKRRSNEFVSSR